MIRGLLDGETVTYDGSWVQMIAARNEPPPLGELPLLIGGSGERRTLRIVARFADGWNGEGDPATWRHKSAVLDEHCAQVGRDPAAIRRTVGLPPACIRDTRQEAVAVLSAILVDNRLPVAEARSIAEASPLVGDEGMVLAAFAAWQDAGAEEAIVDWPAPFDHETLDRLADSLGLHDPASR